MAPRAKETADPRYKCKTCGKLFSRSDSLKRHQAVHDSHHVVKPRKRSCLWCSRAKVRCSGERPSCAACKRKKQACNYDACRSPEPQEEDAPISTGPDDMMLDPEPMDDTFDYANLMGNISYQNLDLNSGTMPDMYSNAPGGHPFDLQPVPFSDLLDLPTGSMMPGFNALETLGLTYDGSPTTSGASPSYISPPRTTPSLSDYSVPTGSGPSKQDIPKAQQTQVSEAQMRSLFPEPNARENPHGHKNWNQDWLLKSQQVQALSFPNRSIPLITARSGPAKNSSLPAAYDFNDLQNIILEQPPWPRMPLNNGLSKEELETCIELYFTEFHPFYNLVHRPTFVISEVPIVLLLAMATLGAALGSFEGCAQLADCLGEWTRRLLIFLAEYNPRHMRTEYYLTAQVMQGIFARLSGNAKLFELIEQLRGALIDSAACIGYHQIERTTNYFGESVEQDWKAWIAEERKARLVWAIYEYDSSAAIMFNARPYVRMAKLRTNFPCDDALWEAPSALEWHRLRQVHSLSGPFFPELLDKMVSSEDDAVIRQIRNIRHLKLLMTSVARMQWTWKEIPSSTPNYFARSKAWKENNNAATDTAKLMSWLSKTIYHFLKSPKSTKETHLAVSNLHIAHMSHLQSAGELLDWLHPFLRGDNPERKRVEAWRARWAFQSLSRVRQAAFNCGQLIGLSRRYPHCFLQQSYCLFHAGTILWSIAPFLNGPPHDGGGASEEDHMPAQKVQALPISQMQSGYGEIPLDSRPQTADRLAEPTGQRGTIVIDELPRLDALNREITPAFATAVLQQQRELTDWLQPSTEDDSSYNAAVQGVPDISTPNGRRRVLEITGELLKDPALPPIAQRFSAVIDYLMAGRGARIHEEGLISRKHMMLTDR